MSGTSHVSLHCATATALTPDWTWEKYPRGYGDAALPPGHDPNEDIASNPPPSIPYNEEEEYTGAGVGPLTPPAPLSPNQVPVDRRPAPAPQTATHIPANRSAP